MNYHSQQSPLQSPLITTVFCLIEYRQTEFKLGEMPRTLKPIFPPKIPNQNIDGQAIQTIETELNNVLAGQTGEAPQPANHTLQFFISENFLTIVDEDFFKINVNEPLLKVSQGGGVWPAAPMENPMGGGGGIIYPRPHVLWDTIYHSFTVSQL